MRDEPLRTSAWEGTGQTTKMRVGIVTVEQIETETTRVTPLDLNNFSLISDLSRLTSFSVPAIFVLGF